MFDPLSTDSSSYEESYSKPPVEYGFEQVKSEASKMTNEELFQSFRGRNRRDLDKNFAIVIYAKGLDKGRIVSCLKAAGVRAPWGFFRKGNNNTMFESRSFISRNKLVIVMFSYNLRVELEKFLPETERIPIFHAYQRFWI